LGGVRVILSGQNAGGGLSSISKMAVQFKRLLRSPRVPRTATGEEIKKAFRKLARQYHPDVAKTKKGAEERSRT